MDATELAALEHANMIDADAAAASQVDGALVRHVGGVALWATGLPMRIFNQVIVEGDAAGPDAIAEAVRIMRERQVRFIVTMRDGTDDHLVPHLVSLGLVPLDVDPWMPGMACSPIDPGGPASAALDIRQVRDDAGLADHIATAAEGFDIPTAWTEALFTRRLMNDPAVRLYVGYVDGRPVATGFGFRTGRTIGVYNVATIESARGRGFGTGITRRIVADGAADGCDVAALQASPMGRPIYERLGFREVVTYRGFIDPAT